MAIQAVVEEKAVEEEKGVEVAKARILEGRQGFMEDSLRVSGVLTVGILGT